MTDQDTTQERIEALETRIAFQEDAIDTLSDQMAKQTLEIEKLNRLITLLNKNIKSLSEGQGAAVNDNQPPPHY